MMHWLWLGSDAGGAGGDFVGDGAGGAGAFVFPLADGGDSGVDCGDLPGELLGAGWGGAGAGGAGGDGDSDFGSDHGVVAGGAGYAVFCEWVDGFGDYYEKQWTVISVTLPPQNVSLSELL